jgi:hypothetical protein
MAALSDGGFLSAWLAGEAGERVPVEKMEPEVVEMYAQDCRARAQEVFLPFRRLVGRGGRTVSDPDPHPPRCLSLPLSSFVSFLIH